MKNHLPIVLIILSFVTLLCAVIIVSCASDNTDNEESSSATESTTQTETVNETTHLVGSELTSAIYTSIESYESTTETATDSTSEETEIITETSESEETETETESISPAPSLAFTSNNNGTCILTGIGNITDSYISIPSRSPEGDIVIAIAEKAFFSNDSIKAIEIPSTVMSIGNMAFSNCRSLLYIAVDSDNTMFKDINGVLFSGDFSTLICYPSGSGMSTFDMPIGVKHISDMAFYNCNGLKTIIYPGTVEEWSKISIGQQNYGLVSAAVSCQ